MSEQLNKFLVAYIYEGENRTNGWGKIEMNMIHEKLTSKDINYIQEYIKTEYGFKQVGVLGFFPLAKEEEDDEEA